MGIVYEKVIVVNELNVGGQSGAGSSAANPSLKFGDGDSGFYEDSDDKLKITLGGAAKWIFDGNFLQGLAASSPGLANETASSTNPTLIPNAGDVDTGIGAAGADALSLIAGGIRAVTITESGNNILMAYPSSIDFGITANAGGGQGSATLLDRSYNVISIVGTNGDSVKLPATFSQGTVMYIINADAAQTLDIFPSSGDDLGAGANNAINIGIGESIIFIATDDNTTWIKIGGSN